MYNGIINIAKEAGFTSHDVVAKMRGILKQKKIGHTGTLDPQATGVLPVCLGVGTKLCDMLTEKEKEYEAVLLLGKTTDTQDTTGQVLEEKEVKITEAEAEAAILSFLGEYSQIPPMYSALKVDGKKLYELARAGKEVERKPRNVTIHEIQILEIKLPEIRFRVSCSKGTYIRTLCHDIGQKLGCGGTMASLCRTRSGRFGLEGAVTLSQLEQIHLEGRMEEILLPVEQIFAELPAVHIRPEFTVLIDNGNAFALTQIQEELKPEEGMQVRVYGSAERFYGIYGFDPEKNRMKPIKMFLENTR